MPDRRFAIFILSHGRPDNVETWKALRNAGWTGDTYLILDDEDETADAYRERYGADRVIMFSKAEIAKTFDSADQSRDRRTVVYARVASFGIARDLGLTHFLQLDDDYTIFLFRSLATERRERGAYRGTPTGPILASPIIKETFDAVVDATLDFLDVSGAITVAWSQGGDHMGGASGGIRKGMKRKAMNAFFVRTDRPIPFVGRINEDVNAYVVDGGRGSLYLTVMGVQFNQLPTQQSAGGMSAVYALSGTYVKSFYTVMMAPSCVKIGSLGRVDFRFHHSISWDHAVPKILSSSWRKDVVPTRTDARAVRPAERETSVRFPVYVPSRNRVETGRTARLLASAGVPFRLVVEPDQAAAYAARYGSARILTLPWDHEDGDRMGLVRARRWIQDHAAESGAEWHWQLDDDIGDFLVRPETKRISASPAVVLAGVEAVATRFDNVLAASPAIDAWVFNGQALPAYNANVGMATANLLNSGMPYRFRAMQDDLDLSLQILSGGSCTVKSYRFLINTPRAMIKPGGLTDAYVGGGKRAFAEEVVEMWPGICSLTQRKNGDWGVRTNYRRFRQRPRAAIPA